jgi:hypothetical protein
MSAITVAMMVAMVMVATALAMVVDVLAAAVVTRLERLDHRRGPLGRERAGAGRGVQASGAIHGGGDLIRFA